MVKNCDDQQEFLFVFACVCLTPQVKSRTAAVWRLEGLILVQLLFLTTVATALHPEWPQQDSTRHSEGWDMTACWKFDFIAKIHVSNDGWRGQVIKDWLTDWSFSFEIFFFFVFWAREMDMKLSFWDYTQKQGSNSTYLELSLDFPFLKDASSLYCITCLHLSSLTHFELPGKFRTGTVVCVRLSDSLCLWEWEAAGHSIHLNVCVCVCYTHNLCPYLTN